MLTQGKSCSDLGRLRVINDLSAWGVNTAPDVVYTQNYLGEEHDTFKLDGPASQRYPTFTLEVRACQDCLLTVHGSTCILVYLYTCMLMCLHALHGPSTHDFISSL
jgi:hypothetical protein